MHGGFVSASAWRYARKLELESIRAQYSFSPSVIVRCHSSLGEFNILFTDFKMFKLCYLLIGAESRADNSARYEL